VDINKFTRDEGERRAVRDELGIRDDQNLLGIIGLLVPLKGHLFLFEALRTVIEAHPELRLLVLGTSVDDRYATKLKDRAKQIGIWKNIIFQDSREDISSILFALDIFVLPSQREGFSRVLLEAMSCSLPIIATDVSGNNEAVVDGETGLLVPYGNVNKLAKAIDHSIARTEDSRLMGKNARKRVEELFSIERHVSQMEELYRKIKQSV